MAARTALSVIHGPAADRLRRWATYASVAVALLLIAVKFAAWLETGSVALLSSLIDSLLDAVASIVNLFAVRHALTPADREHRFGHGKAEPLAVLGQSAFITGSALLLLAEAVRRLIQPAAVENPPAGIAVMVFSIAVTIALVLFQRHVVRRTGSIAITADELHYRSDLILNASVIAALVLSGIFGLRILDPLFGAAIGVWIIYSAARLARLSLVQLMDRELPDDERESDPRDRAVASRGGRRPRSAHPRRRADRVHPDPYRNGRRYEPDSGARNLRRGRGQATRRLPARRDHHSSGPGRGRRATVELSAKG